MPAHRWHDRQVRDGEHDLLIMTCHTHAAAIAPMLLTIDTGRACKNSRQRTRETQLPYSSCQG